VSTIFYFGTIVATAITVVVGFVTLIINFFNRADKSEISVVYVPFKSVISRNTTQFLIDYRWPVLLLSGFCCSLFLLEAYYRQRRRLKSARHLDFIFREFNTILTELREFTVHSILDGRLTRLQYEGYVKEVSYRIESFLVSSANRISGMMAVYTGAPCHVSIKIYNNKMVKTIARDELSSDNREAVDETLGWYSFDANAAFQKILNDSHSLAFRSNHLVLASWTGKYWNTHAGWRKYYRASLVVPITMQTDAAAITDATIWGFLCVDNKIGGFRGSECVSLLQAFSRMYAFVLSVSSQIPTQRQEDAKFT
jgi:hypothetical protein